MSPTSRPSLATPGRHAPIAAVSLALLLLVVLVCRVHGDSPDQTRDRKISLAGKKVRVHPKEEQSSSYRLLPSKVGQDFTAYQKPASNKNPTQRNPARNSQRTGSAWQRPVQRSEKPNIIVILTDDQDVLLGSLKYMPKLQNLLIRQGVYFNNSFVPTPMCCPSRSTFLTGMYVHNHNVYTNNANCSSPEWQRQHEVRNFATYVNKTYTTGYFGKYLNEYDGNHIPPGWHRWVGLIKNSRFYNYSVVDERGVKVKHGDNYYADYLTDLVANDSRAFLQDNKRRFPTKPVMMVLSLPAPHGPEDAAPQYQHMFVNNTDHRTQSWNFAPNPDKQWLLQHIYPMMPQHKIFTDLLQRRRLQTLQSVDDLVENLVNELNALGELDNTYIVYTSDHGYHLGQFGLIKGKAMPFDFDTRVPLIIRGPGIQSGTIISNIVSNVDIAPTIIDMAEEPVPDHMDGDSIMRLIRAAKDPSNVDKRGFVEVKKRWRDTILLERGKLTEKAMKQRMRTERDMIKLSPAGATKGIHFYIPARAMKVALECSKDEYRYPCKPLQKWYCFEEDGRHRKEKCQNNKPADLATESRPVKDLPLDNSTCLCPKKKDKYGLSKVDPRRQRRFLKKQTDSKSRHVRNRRSSRTNVSSSNGGFSGLESMFDRRCRILANQSVLCDLDIYQKASEWEMHKERIDDMIREYRKALEDLRDIRRHLKEQRPIDAVEDDYDDDELENVDSVVDTADEDCVCEHEDLAVDSDLRKLDDKMAKRESRQEAREKRRQQRKLRRRKKNDIHCNTENMNCFTHDNDHWKTPPYWHYGPFCFCSNANNNTYWCLRTINQTHDFLYCEFITTFLSYYNLKADPFQLKNAVTELNYGILQQLHDELKKLRQCKGNKDCTHWSGQKTRITHDPNWPGLINLQRAKNGNDYEDYEDNGEEFYDDFFTKEKDNTGSSHFGLSPDYE
ncbi:hypothetical protein BsWGS_24033 [Bradybaena similaris]